MAGRFEGLNDLEWKLFEDIFPTSDSRSPGMPSAPFRYVLNSLLYILITGCRWCDLPRGKALGATFKMVDALHSLDTNYRILLTIVLPKPNKAGSEARVAVANAEFRLFDSEIQRLAVFQKAALEGVPVNAVKDSYAAIAWQCYVQLVAGFVDWVNLSKSLFLPSTLLSELIFS